MAFFESIWLVCMTLFTVGYGDVTPHTLVGKLLAIVTAMWGAFLISFTVVTLTNIFQLSQNQLKAHKHIVNSQSAARSISLALKYFWLKKKYYLLKIKRDPSVLTSSPFLQLVVS